MEGLLSTGPTPSSFLTVTQSYYSKVTPIGALHAEKIAEAVLLYVFRIAFPASLFSITLNTGLFNIKILIF